MTAADARLAVELWLREMRMIYSHDPPKVVGSWMRSGTRVFIGALMRLWGWCPIFEDLNAAYEAAV